MLFTSPYQYRFRSEYGSNNLLLEFISGVEHARFGEDLLDAIKELNPKITSSEDLWVNDEILYEVSTDMGPCLLSKSTWGIAFITVENNQPCLARINELLERDKRFIKTQVDFKDYKNT